MCYQCAQEEVRVLQAAFNVKASKAHSEKAKEIRRIEERLHRIVEIKHSLSSSLFSSAAAAAAAIEAAAEVRLGEEKPNTMELQQALSGALSIRPAALAYGWAPEEDVETMLEVHDEEVSGGLSYVG